MCVPRMQKCGEIMYKVSFWNDGPTFPLNKNVERLCVRFFKQHLRFLDTRLSVNIIVSHARNPGFVPSPYLACLCFLIEESSNLLNTKLEIGMMIMSLFICGTLLLIPCFPPTCSLIYKKHCVCMEVSHQPLFHLFLVQIHFIGNIQYEDNNAFV